ncbi:MAG TPA: hypothetical protein VJ944_00225 [Thermoplasmataceae archaeon]|nr:hypothetical protein [Thermoplasmataceae archaeon]
MPIKKDSFFKQRTDKYMESMESIVFFLYTNKDRAFTSSEIAYETDIPDKDLVIRVLGDLKKDAKIIERLIFDGKQSDFYYIINEEEIEKEHEKAEEKEGTEKEPE